MTCECGASVAHPVRPPLVDFRASWSLGADSRGRRTNRMNGVEDHLRHAIREMILAGNLPKENCRMTWYGPGTGGVCVACEQRIAAEELEVECDLPKGGTIRLHRRWCVMRAAAGASRGRGLTCKICPPPAKTRVVGAAHVPPA